MTDFKLAFRQLLKNPGFTAVAGLTLALGIGANTVIFSVVRAVILRPLPYPESERLVWLSERHPNFPAMSISYPNFEDWQSQQTVFESLGVCNSGSYNLTGTGHPLRLRGSRISAGALAALRVPPTLGRFFTKDDDQPGAAPVLLLSHRFWSSQWGGNSNIVNQPVTLDGRVFTVVGVMPADFAFPSEVDLWIPVGLMAGEGDYQQRGNHPGLLGVARLKPGITLQQARVEMDAIAGRLEKTVP